MNKKIIPCDKCSTPFTGYYYNGILKSKNCPKCNIEILKSKVKQKPVLTGTELLIKKSKAVKRTKTKRQLAQRRADMYFSRYIRIKHSQEVRSGEVLVFCYTCGRPCAIKRADNGHYVSREHKIVRYHVNNARPQCKYCNQHRSGRHTEFEAHLIKEVGKEEVEELKRLALQDEGEDNEIFYTEQAELYRGLLNQELRMKHMKNPWL